MSVTGIEDMIRAIVRDELARRDMKPANEDEQRITVAEYARRWNISPSTVRAAIREKRLEATRVGRAVRIAAGAQIGRSAVDDATERARLVLMRGAKVR